LHAYSYDMNKDLGDYETSHSDLYSVLEEGVPISISLICGC